MAGQLEAASEGAEGKGARHHVGTTAMIKRASDEDLQDEDDEDDGATSLHAHETLSYETLFDIMGEILLLLCL